MAAPNGMNPANLESEAVMALWDYYSFASVRIPELEAQRDDMHLQVNHLSQEIQAQAQARETEHGQWLAHDAECRKLFAALTGDNESLHVRLKVAQREAAAREQDLSSRLADAREACAEADDARRSALQRAEAATARTQAAETRLKTEQKELDALRRQLDESNRREAKMADDLSVLRACLVDTEAAAAQAATDAAHAAVTARAEELSALEATHAAEVASLREREASAVLSLDGLRTSHAETIAQMREKHAQQLATAEASLRAALDASSRSAAEAREEARAARSELAELQAKSVGLQAALTDERETALRLAERLQETEAELADRQADLASLAAAQPVSEAERQADKESLTAALARAHTSTSAAEAERDGALEAARALQEELKEVRSSLSAAEREMTRLKEIVIQAADELDGARSTAEAVTNERDDLAADLAAAKDETASARAQCQQLQSDFAAQIEAALTAAHAAREDEISQLRSRLDAADKRLAEAIADGDSRVAAAEELSQAVKADADARVRAAERRATDAESSLDDAQTALRARSAFAGTRRRFGTASGNFDDAPATESGPNSRPVSVGRGLTAARHRLQRSQDSMLLSTASIDLNASLEGTSGREPVQLPRSTARQLLSAFARAESVERDLHNAHAELADSERRLETVVASRDRYRNDCSRLEAELDSAKRLAERNTDSTRAEMASERRSLLTRVSEAEGRARRAEADLDRLRLDLDRTRQAQTELQAALEVARQRNAAFEASSSSPVRVPQAPAYRRPAPKLSAELDVLEPIPSPPETPNQSVLNASLRSELERQAQVHSSSGVGPARSSAQSRLPPQRFPPASSAQSQRSVMPSVTGTRAAPGPRAAPGTAPPGLGATGASRNPPARRRPQR
jgi:chromosome segregation ATPase